MDQPNFCQSCGMPMNEEKLFGTEKEGGRSKEYCCYCYENGEFSQPNITVAEMINFCIPFLEEDGMSREEAERILQNSIPYLKRWNQAVKLEPKIVKMDELNILGIGTRTSNREEADGHGKIPVLWDQYYGEMAMGKISEPINPNIIYGVYSDYESDMNGSYDFTIGLAVESLREVPSGLVLKKLPASTYAVFTSGKGPIKEIVTKLWFEIWAWFAASDLKRTYTGDFESYDERSADVNNAQVDIYIAVEAEK